MAEWHEPQGGMFIWFKLLGIKDANKLIIEQGLKNNVLLAPGSIFSIDKDKPSPYVRASYSTVTDEEMERVSAFELNVLK